MENAISNSAISNVLGFFTETGDLKIDEMSRFLEISRAELASAFNLTADKIRPNRIAAKTKERLKELAGAIEFVAETFEGDVNKAKKWINSPNLNFGGSSPKSLILKGRVSKVTKFVYAAKSGY
ncbi:antitoxin Xre/MbcA/ParS toxin-binding domain-containing protein [Halobacteriovorax sp. DA5]|uniref:antitoxin Xre/MbcA/ParS toxin-binding domain-containing protein n=1 Tax=Halobacteriovorax sp. DA5 TaxID=2067553 RepID=UPI000CD0A2DE|nr:antitoxin Xre/MbcA/ParS toxin-binding domain-containing protein [Halobacteriovorax sp. DA5]POB13631.1 hypothetical protein C0Z22_10730 [Halobacteriovorax sp. DA5]